ncbi:MAG TPA: hypothetical protein VJU79_04790 [Candidatus Dormibacteraeota bacterium]|nr:hypothetical protein [Candidatus Dormibacteraeota bacterium]
MPGYRRAYRTAKRMVPLVLAAKRHWDNLEEHEKEEYRERARKYAAVAGAYAREAKERAPFPRGDGGGGRKKRGRRR